MFLSRQDISGHGTYDVTWPAKVELRLTSLAADMADANAWDGMCSGKISWSFFGESPGSNGKSFIWSRFSY